MGDESRVLEDAKSEAPSAFTAAAAFIELQGEPDAEINRERRKRRWRSGEP